jgi:hypothetical protein
MKVYNVYIHNDIGKDEWLNILLTIFNKYRTQGSCLPCNNGLIYF